jgi:hypothetical protein
MFIMIGYDKLLFIINSIYLFLFIYVYIYITG